MKTKEFKYDSVVMTDEELVDTINKSVEKMTMDEVLKCMNFICENSEKEEPGVLKAAAPIERMSYIAMGMYKYGFAAAVYLMNETFKKFFADDVEEELKVYKAMDKYNCDRDVAELMIADEEE